VDRLNEVLFSSKKVAGFTFMEAGIRAHPFGGTRIALLSAGRFTGCAYIMEEIPIMQTISRMNKGHGIEDMVFIRDSLMI